MVWSSEILPQILGRRRIFKDCRLYAYCGNCFLFARGESRYVKGSIPQTIWTKCVNIIGNIRLMKPAKIRPSTAPTNPSRDDHSTILSMTPTNIAHTERRKNPNLDKTTSKDSEAATQNQSEYECCCIRVMERPDDTATDSKQHHQRDGSR